jgi:hypothetical protein
VAAAAAIPFTYVLSRRILTAKARPAAEPAAATGPQPLSTR